MPAPIEVVRRQSINFAKNAAINFDDHFDFYSSPISSEVEDNLMFEASFCRDFICCGVILADLHDLLQHYEDSHVRFEDEHPPLDDDLSSSDGSVPSSPLMDTMDTKSFFGRKTKNGYTIADLHPESLEYPAFETYNDSAAFDTSILRSPQKGNKKRSNGALDTINPVAKKLVVSNGFGDAQNVLGEEDFLAQAGNLLSLTNTNADKPYKCPVPGCDKAYKNPNGLKYHNQHGHCNAHASLDGDKTAQKPFGCPVPECGKRYKNLNGLKYHLDHSHMPVLHNMSAASSVLASLGVSGTTFEPRLMSPTPGPAPISNLN